MLNIEKLLVATDFSARSARAERRAAVLCAASQCGTPVLLAVTEPEQIEMLVRMMDNSVETVNATVVEAALLELRARAADLKQEFNIEFAPTVRIGQPAVEIAASSEEVRADLIVIGAHGGNFFSDIFLGNTADKLIRRCKRPLLIVKNEPQSVYRHILVPVDFSDDSRQATKLALALEPQAAITVLHAYDAWYASKMSYAGVSQDHIDEYRLKARTDALTDLNRFIDELDVPQRSIMRHVVPGHPSVNVRDYAEKKQADLIVIGKHGRSRLEELLVGSVTRDTIDWAKCDVMVVPPA